MAGKLTDRELNDQNLAHIPHEDPAPADTRVTPTPRDTVAHAEIAAGAAAFDPTPPARFQPVTNDWEMRGPMPTGNPTIITPFEVELANPIPTGEPSGARITPVGCGSDTTGR